MESSSEPSVPAQLPQPEHTLSNQDVDQLLTATSRTRQRIRKACYPCNKRKIKCDRDERTPCTNCAKRPHPELCTFDDHAPRSNNPRPRPSISHRPSSHSPALPLGYPSTPSHRGLHGIHSANTAYTHTPQTNGSGHEYSSWGRPPNGMEAHGPPGTSSTGRGYGYNSSAPNAARVAIGIPPPSRLSYSSFQPINPTYVAADTQGGTWHQISPLLPPQKHLLRFFEIYRTICNPLYPVIPDLDNFEAAVCTYFEDATSSRLRSEVDGLSGSALEARLSWFALLSATIATGVQYSDIKQAERKALVHEYFRNSMQLLRLANFLFKPTEVCIMSLLLLCRILQNEFQPEASWSLLGMIARFAESIGLHTPDYSTTTDLKTREAEINRRRKIWFSILWQESYLTMCFGKPSSLPANDTLISATSTNLAYQDCMHTLCAYAIDARRHDSSIDRATFGRGIDAIAAVRHLHEHALPRLADKQKCRSIQDRMEYFSFRIHQGSVVSQLSQILMKACVHLGLHPQRELLVSMCRTSAVDCVQAYVDMQSFSVVPTRTWSLTFNALSAALLLGTLAKDDPEAAKDRELLATLLDVLQRGEESDEHEDGHRHGHLDWLSRYTSALLALRDMSAGTLPETKKEPQEDADARNGDADENRDGDREQRAKLEVFLDPPALWATYFSNTTAADEGSLQLLPQQFLFGI